MRLSGRNEVVILELLELITELCKERDEGQRAAIYEALTDHVRFVGSDDEVRDRLGHRVVEIYGTLAGELHAMWMMSDRVFGRHRDEENLN